MQFRLRAMLYFVALFCVWCMAFTYMSYGRQVQFWAKGRSWEVKGPTAYHVSVETFDPVANLSSGPTTVRLLPYQTAGVRNGDSAKNSGRKFVFPVRQNHELTVTDPAGEEWKYRFTFLEQSFGLVLYAGCMTLALPTAGTILVVLGLRYALVRRGNRHEVDRIL